MTYNVMAQLHGVVFNGIQTGLKGKSLPLFTHKVYGTFAMMPGETLADSIKRKEEQFRNVRNGSNDQQKGREQTV